jgi:transposase
MPAPIRIELTETTRAELVARFNATHDADARLRYQMVLLAADGRTAPQIAPLVQRSAVAVWRVLKRYLAGGPAAAAPRPRPGRPPAAPPAWAAELRRVIDLDPHAVGVDSANWTTGLLAAHLARTTGHATSDEAVRLALHRAGYGCKRPGWTLKRKAEEDPGWAGNG